MCFQVCRKITLIETILAMVIVLLVMKIEIVTCHCRSKPAKVETSNKLTLVLLFSLTNILERERAVSCLCKGDPSKRNTTWLKQKGHGPKADKEELSNMRMIWW